MTFWIVALFAAGIALVFAEFFVPGMILGILGTVSLISSAALAVMYAQDHAIVIILLELLGLVVTIGLGMFVLPRSPVGRRMILHTSQDPNQGWISTASNESLVGVVAVVATALRPAGTIYINDERVSAVTAGEFVDAGAKVRVREVHGNRIVVERVEHE